MSKKALLTRLHFLTDGFQPLDLEDYLVSKSNGQARLSFKQEDESFNDVLLTPETKCALRMDHRRYIKIKASNKL